MPSTMTPDDIRNARGALGELWGLGRPVSKTELGRVLRSTAARPNEFVEHMETGRKAITGPVSTAIEAMLDGGRPSHLEACLNRKRG